jgi:hypothetical protein
MFQDWSLFKCPGTSYAQDASNRVNSGIIFSCSYMFDKTNYLQITLSNYSSRTNYRIATKLSYDEDKLISYKGWPLLVGVHVHNNSNNSRHICHRGSNGSSTNATDIVYFHTFCIRYQRPRAPTSPQLKLKMHTYPDTPDRSVSNKYSIFMQYTKKSYHYRPSTELISG